MFVVFLERRTQIRIALAFLVFLMAAAVRVGTMVTTHTWQARAGLLPIRSVETKHSAVGLSFDLNEGQKNLQQLLNILQENNIKATFFINGEWANEHPQLVERIHQLQQEVANGGFTSEKHPTLGPHGVADSITQTHRALLQVLDEEPTALFRPPGGYYDDMVVETALEAGYHTVLWRLDSRDSVTRNAHRTVKWVSNRVNPGDILRFSADDAGHEAGRILEGVIAALGEKGLSLMAVGDLLQLVEH